MNEHTFASVWDAIEDTPAAAASMRARSDIMIAIRGEIEKWNLSEADAARRLGVTLPCLDDLLRGRIDWFDLETLVSLAPNAGLDVAWRITPRAA